MRTLPLVCTLFLVILPVASRAGGLDYEPHAMLYYQISLDGGVRDSGHSFGLRLDQTVVEEGQMIEFQQLMKRPGLLDLRFSHGGLQSLSIAGVDYAGWYRVQRAEEEAAGSAESGAAAGTGEAAETGAQPPEEEKLTIGGVLEKTPVGVLIGVGLGIVLIAGISEE